MKIQLDFKKRLDDTKKILVSLYINNKQCVFILDTGSYENVIDLQFVTNNFNNVPKPRKTLIGGFNSQKKEKCTYIKIEDINFENIFKTDIDFFSVNFDKTCKMFKESYNIDVIGILGLDFMKKNNLIINFKNNSIEYEDNN